jgi:hypothetical protein
MLRAGSGQLSHSVSLTTGIKFHDLVVSGDFAHPYGQSYVKRVAINR